MKDNNKPETVVHSQTQAVNFWEAQPDLNSLKNTMFITISNKPEVKELKRKLRLSKIRVDKLTVATDAEKEKALEIKKRIQADANGLLKLTKQGKKILDDLHKHARAIEKDFVDEYTGEGGIVEKIDKMVQAYATAEAVAEQKKNNAAIAKAADDTRKLKENLLERAIKCEETKPAKAEQLIEEAEVAEAQPEITYEDPKNWRFESVVTDKRKFLRWLIDNENSDLSGIVIQKSLLNAVARAVMNERPQEFKKIPGGHCKGKKIK